MSKSKAVREINERYPRLTARLNSGEIRITEVGIDQERAEAIAYYTEDADDALGTAEIWSYSGETRTGSGMKTLEIIDAAGKKVEMLLDGTTKQETDLIDLLNSMSCKFVEIK